MIVGIYARKSTDDSDRNTEARSTRRQIESGTKYATAKGWTVDPRYIFVDENTSGAEWKHRPGWRRDSLVPERCADQSPTSRARSTPSSALSRRASSGGCSKPRMAEATR